MGLCKRWGQVITTRAPRTNKSGTSPLPKTRNMSKIKCFNCDLYGHLAKDYSKLPWVNEIPPKVEKLFKGDLMPR
jgi:hypothetical protein